MNYFPDLLPLFADGLVVAAAAWLLARGCLSDAAGRLEFLLGSAVAAVAIVAAAGEILGSIGWFSAGGFRIFNLGLLVLLAWGRGDQLRDDRRELSAAMIRAGAFFRAGGAGPGLALLFLVVVLSLGVFSFCTQPVVFDSLTYQLPRIAHWLQEGRIEMVVTDDARVNYMPVVPSMMMAWCMAGAKGGYSLAAVPQGLGGVMAALATVGLARECGLGRKSAIAAALLLPGMANLAPQFSSTYTDLFATGILSSAVFLWLVALRRGEGSWLGGVAAALALGSKGTVFFIAPGLGLAAGWFAWRQRARGAVWSRTLFAGMLGVALFVLPGMVRNFKGYGGVFGPTNFVVQHLGRAQDFDATVAKLRLNLATSFAQVFEPNSQPPWWRDQSRVAGLALASRLPEADPYSFDGLDRRANLEKIFALTAPDADVTTTGVLLPLLALVAWVTALSRLKSPGAETVLVWAVVLGEFVLVLHARLQWNPYLFRFMVLGAPGLAVSAAWWVNGLGRKMRLFAWTLLALHSAVGIGAATFLTYQSGWQATVRPAQSFGYFVFDQWRIWSMGLDKTSEPLRPALSENRPLAAFYRQESGRRALPFSVATIKAASAEQLVQGESGWVIVQAGVFLGREGRVMARTWLLDGDEKNEFSLAAYRTLIPGEQTPPLLYRNRLVDSTTSQRRELLVKTWDGPSVNFEVYNPGLAAAHGEIRTPLGNQAVDLAPAEKKIVSVMLPANRVSLVTVDFPRPEPNPTGSRVVDVHLVR